MHRSVGIHIGQLQLMLCHSNGESTGVQFCKPYVHHMLKAYKCNTPQNKIAIPTTPPPNFVVLFNLCNSGLHLCSMGWSISVATLDP